QRRVLGGGLVLRSARGVVEVVPQPAAPPAAARAGGMPDGHALKVAAVGLRIAAAVDDREHSLVVQLLEGGHARVQGILVAQVEQALREGDARAYLLVLVVLEGNDGVQTVVSA